MRIEYGSRARAKLACADACARTLATMPTSLYDAAFIFTGYSRLLAADCLKSGMTREEAESFFRAEFTALFPTETDAESLSTDGFECVLDEIRGALDATFGPPKRDPMDLVRLLTAHMPAPPSVPICWLHGPSAHDFTLAVRDVRTDDLVRASWFSEAFDPYHVGAWHVYELVRHRQRDAQALGTKPYPIILSLRQFAYSENMRPVGQRLVLGSATGASGTWRLPNGRAETTFDAMIRVGAAMSRLRNTEWLADITVGGPIVRLWIGPHEAKDLFALRDIEDGAQRRAALLHIVRAHHRRKPFTAADTVRVRNHIRGRDTCTWKGGQVKLYAPPMGDA